jgi:hypothetical protein
VGEGRGDLGAVGQAGGKGRGRNCDCAPSAASMMAASETPSMIDPSKQWHKYLRARSFQHARRALHRRAASREHAVSEAGRRWAAFRWLFRIASRAHRHRHRRASRCAPPRSRAPWTVAGRRCGPLCCVRAGSPRGYSGYSGYSGAVLWEWRPDLPSLRHHSSRSLLICCRCSTELSACTASPLCAKPRRRCVADASRPRTMQQPRLRHWQATGSTLGLAGSRSTAHYSACAPIAPRCALQVSSSAPAGGPAGAPGGCQRD